MSRRPPGARMGRPRAMRAACLPLAHAFTLAAALLIGSNALWAAPAPATTAATIPALATPAAVSAPPRWAFETSDVPLDPVFHCGALPNGMRYIIVPNATPKGVVQIRMQVSAGSLDETDDERGYAHFVEHMAFQGSTHVQPGEMVRLLERLGLAFGADTNAFTTYEHTTYVLDLPRADPGLFDTALMLMRETASELRFPAEAVERERGVVLAEKRDRNTTSQRAGEDEAAFLAPDSRYAHRMPIGTPEALAAANPDRLRAFWAREYVPAKTTVIVVGDLDAKVVEAAIRAHFTDWAPKPDAAPSPPQPDAGPISPTDSARTRIWMDPALAGAMTITRAGPWQPDPDTLARRRDAILRNLGYGIINRRLERFTRLADQPFRRATLSTQPLFHAARLSSLQILVANHEIGATLGLVALEYRRALAQGFTRTEVDEQIANLREFARNAAAGANTRTDEDLMAAALNLIRREWVPTPPQDDLAMVEALAPKITAQTVLAALRADLVPLDAPLIRYQGHNPLPGGEATLRAAWDEAMRKPLSTATAAADAPTASFAYTSFGVPGTVVADMREPGLGLRQIRFANGVMLNLKRTDLARDQVLVSLNLDGGELLATPDNPLAVDMVPMLSAGGLGKYSADQLQTQMAGHSVGIGLSASPDSFSSTVQTTPADLGLQLRLLTALITDPGWRPEGEVQFHNAIGDVFTQSLSDPQHALQTYLGGILSDGDPRFTRQPLSAYQALDFRALKQSIGDRLAHGAIELAIVGDIDEAQTIALVGQTLGALPARELQFGTYAQERQRSFTADRSEHVLHHMGPADQAAISFTWPTRDAGDPVANQQLNMLEKVLEIELLESLRQKLGKAYSPRVNSDRNRTWTGYGTLTVWTGVDVKDVAAARAAVDAAVSALRAKKVSADILERARQPLAEIFDNELKGNGGWLAVASRAQSRPDAVERQLHARSRALAVTAADVQAAARRYLAPESAVVVTVLPLAAAAPAKAPPVNPPAPAPAALSHAGDKTAP